MITTVPTNANLQTFLEAVQPGDTLLLQPGARYIGNFRLRNKGATAANPITITTQGFNVPAGQRVKPSDFPTMAKVLAATNIQQVEAVLANDGKTGGYKFIGVEFGVNYGTDLNRQYHPSFLINFDNGGGDNPAYGEWLSHDITIDRCHVAGKFGDARFAVVFNGRNLSLINSYVDEFANPLGGGDSAGVWMGSGPGPYTIENNFISAGMWQIFTGGADGDSPNFGMVGAGSTATSVMLTGMQGAAPVLGDYVAFQVRSQTPTPQPWRANSAYSKGEVLYRPTAASQPSALPPVLFYVRQAGVSGPTEPDFFNAHENRPLEDGSVRWHQEVTGHQIGKVTAVQGGTLTVEPTPTQGLVLPPTAGTKAKWNGNLPSDVLIRRNHFFRPGAWAASGAQNKGMFQFKAARRFLIEGNYFESEVQYPGLLGLSAGNQSGRAPWSTVRDIAFRNNRVRHLGTIANITLTDTFGKFAVPGSDIDFVNNLLTEMGGPLESELSWFLLASNANGIRYVHNTVLNNYKLLFLYGANPQTGFVMRDNILTYNVHMNCELGEPHLSKCLPGAIVTANAIVNVPADRRSEFPVTNFFPAAHADVGFVALGSREVNGWALQPTSPYKGKATDGKDIGVDIAQLQTALSGASSPVPTPLPTPAPTPSPSPTPPTTSPNGTKATTIVDGAGKTWTLRAVPGDTLRDGAHMGGGQGFMYKWLDGVVYVLGTNEFWYMWNGSSWVRQSTNEPGPPQPSPTPTPTPTPIPPSTSPDGTKAPPAPSIVDSTGGVWTIGPQLQTLRNGVHMAGGFGSVYKWLGGVVYVRGTNDWWYKWTNTSWVSVSQQEPGTVPPVPTTRKLAWPKQDSARNQLLSAQRIERFFLKEIRGDTAEFEKVA